MPDARHWQLAVRVKQGMEHELDGMTREVRALLRHARNIDRLRASPVIADLCVFFHSTDPALALRRVVDETLGAPEQRTLHRLIVGCDLDGTFTQEGMALELSVSRRQYARMRSQAVELIASRIREIRGSDSALPASSLETLAATIAEAQPQRGLEVFALLASQLSPKGTLRRMHALVQAGEPLSADAIAHFAGASPIALYAVAAQGAALAGDAQRLQSLRERLHALTEHAPDPLAVADRFELSALSFICARARNDAATMRASAREMLATASGPTESKLRAIAYTTEAALHENDLAEAREMLDALARMSTQHRDRYYMSIALLLQATLEFLNARFPEAQRCAAIAAIALEHHPFDAQRCAVLAARTQLAIDGPRAIVRRGSAHPAGRDTVALEALDARASLAEGNDHDAIAECERIAAVAERHSYHGIVAHCRATMAAAFDALGRGEPARMFYAASLESYLATGDWDVGFDLFCIPGMPEREFGPLEADILVDIFEASMIRAVPELAFDGLAAKRALQAWARCALDIAAEKTPAFTRLEQCAEALSDYRSAFVPYMRERPREMERLMASLLLPLVPFSRRTALRQRIAAIVGNVVGLMSADGYAARAFGPA